MTSQKATLIVSQFVLSIFAIGFTLGHTSISDARPAIEETNSSLLNQRELRNYSIAPTMIQTVRQTQSGREIVKTSDGQFFVELKQGEYEPATAQDVYEAYRAQMLDVFADTSNLREDQQPRKELAGLLQNRVLHHGPHDGVIGFFLPDFAVAHATIYRYSRADRKIALDRNYARPSRTVMTESDQRAGLLLVGTVQNPQGPLDRNDPLNNGDLEAVIALRLFIKLNP